MAPTTPSQVGIVRDNANGIWGVYSTPEAAHARIMQEPEGARSYDNVDVFPVEACPGVPSREAPAGACPRAPQIVAWFRHVHWHSRLASPELGTWAYIGAYTVHGSPETGFSVRDDLGVTRMVGPGHPTRALDRTATRPLFYCAWTTLGLIVEGEHAGTLVYRPE